MTRNNWLEHHTASLHGKTIAVTGSTGGLGKALCNELAKLNASLILVDRNQARSHALRDELVQRYPSAAIQCLTADLADFDSVKAATDKLIALAPDIFIHNAGAYSIPRKTCSTGFDNIFQINFVSPYYMINALLPTLRRRHGHVVVVGSIAHNYSKSDPAHIDFSDRKAASKVYGNAKRYLMYALDRLFAEETDVTLAVTHPGISFTGITDHYPKPIFMIIKHPMKIIFMKPKKACLSILYGVFTPCRTGEWIGPRWFDVWGYPRKKRLTTATKEEQQQILETAKNIYENLKK